MISKEEKKLDCTNWANGYCRYGDRCHFAHRPLSRSPISGSLISRHSSSYTKISSSTGDFQKYLMDDDMGTLRNQKPSREETCMERVEYESERQVRSMIRYVHFILAVDTSGSVMPYAGELLAALETALNKIHAANPDHRVSIFCFSNSVRRFIQYKKPKEALYLLSGLPFIGEGTKFGPPFEETLSLIETYPMPTTLVFMTDGQADYPGREVFQLNSYLNQIKHKMYLYIIGIGSEDKKSINKIIKVLNGRYHFTASFSGLMRKLTEVIEINIVKIRATTRH